MKRADSIRFLAAVSDRRLRVASVRDALDFGPPNHPYLIFVAGTTGGARVKKIFPV